MDAILNEGAAVNAIPAVGRPPAETARRRVLEQHVELRKLLAAGLDHVRATLSGDLSAQVPLSLLVDVTYDEFVRHLADEEALIVPILEDDLPLGPLRVAQLRDEHGRQCAELEALRGWPERQDQTNLATRFGALALALLDDIEHEERELLTPDIIRDDGIVVDQCGG